jgi:hypothetical protein
VHNYSKTSRPRRGSPQFPIARQSKYSLPAPDLGLLTFLLFPKPRTPASPSPLRVAPIHQETRPNPAVPMPNSSAVSPHFQSRSMPTSNSTTHNSRPRGTSQPASALRLHRARSSTHTPTLPRPLAAPFLSSVRFRSGATPISIIPRTFILPYTWQDLQINPGRMSIMDSGMMHTLWRDDPVRGLREQGLRRLRILYLLIWGEPAAISIHIDRCLGIIYDAR